MQVAHRVALAAGAVLLMLIVASMAVAVWLTAPMSTFDGGGAADQRRADLVGLAGLAVGVVLFVATGPVAHAITKRRSAMAVPLALLAVWALVIGLAAITDLP